MEGVDKIQNQDSVPVALLYIDLVRAHEFLALGFAKLFKRYGVSQPQYNVLRAIHFRGGERGLPIKDIRQRLINRIPDVTRFIDRMEKVQLVRRVHDKHDRRIVRVKLTPRGDKLLLKLDQPVLKLHEKQLGHLLSKEIETGRALLKKIVEPSVVPLNKRL